MQAAVLRECVVNLARIKEAVSQSVGGTLDAAGLDSWQDLMRGMKAGLLLLGKSRAVEIIEAITTQLKRVMQPGVHVLPPGFIDRLADAIVSVEYYMETLQAGRSDPWYMLDNAQSCVAALEQQPTPAAPTVPPLEPGAYAKTVQIPSVAPAPAAAPPDAARGGCGGADARRLAAAKPAAPPEHADPELMKLFIEEAHEELGKIQRGFPALGPEPARARVAAHRAPLLPHAEGQRAHGRRARAGRVRLVDRESAEPRARQHAQPLAADPRHAARGRGGAARARRAARKRRGGQRGRSRYFLARPCTCRGPRHRARRRRRRQEDAGRSGGYLERHGHQRPALERGRTRRPGLRRIARRGARTPDGPADPSGAARRAAPARRARAAASVPHAAGAAPARGAVLAGGTAQPAVPPDDTLRDIYARETAAHIATVRAFLARESTLPEPHALTEDVYRACHTLSGSSKMAQARHGIRLAEPLDHWLRRAFSSGAGLGTEDLTLLGDCMVAMEAVATHLDEPTGFFVNHWQLLERIERADRGLEQRIAAAAAHAGLQPPAAAGNGADTRGGGR